MNGINGLKLNGNYQFGTKKVETKKEEEKATLAQNEKAPVKGDEKALWSAMEIASTQARANIVGPKINPKDYLTDERIAEIQASMGVFSKEVDGQKAAFASELGPKFSNLSEAQQNAIAAKSISI